MDDYDARMIGRRLRQIRTARGKSPQVLAELLTRSRRDAAGHELRGLIWFIFITCGEAGLRPKLVTALWVPN